MKMMNGNMKNRNTNSGNQWETPEYIYDPLNKEFNFDFDPCPLRPEEEITPETDGLLTEWGGCNFINPPYKPAKLKEAFIMKAIEESKKGKTCVLLIPAATDTVIYHEHIVPNAKEIRFLKGRVKFKGFNTKGESVTNNCGMSGSMIIVL
jgi:site-specific DNA-methyltransferase (adenine-specific)